MRQIWERVVSLSDVTTTARGKSGLEKTTSPLPCSGGCRSRRCPRSSGVRCVASGATTRAARAPNCILRTPRYATGKARWHERLVRLLPWKTDSRTIPTRRFWRRWLISTSIRATHPKTRGPKHCLCGRPATRESVDLSLIASAKITATTQQASGNLRAISDAGLATSTKTTS